MSGRSVLVTGGSRGIGLATARRFAADGDRVALLARPSRELDLAAADLGALKVECDISDGAAIDGAVARVVAHQGAIEVLINNAGVALRQAVDGHPLPAWDYVMAVNLRAPFLFARAVLPAMRAAGQGRIINISSVHGRVGAARMGAYCATKFGLLGFTQSLAEEVKGDGVVVTALCPASVDTRILKGTGLAPEVTPEAVAEAIFFLAKAPPAVAGTAMDMFG